MKIKYCLALMFLFALCGSINAQSGSNDGISTGYAVLTKTIELKSATVGQEVNLRIMGDIVANGKIAIAKDAQLVGHISAVTMKGNGAPESQLSVVVDKIIKKDGSEMPVQGIIAAIAAAQDSLTTDNMPKMIGGSSNPNPSPSTSTSSNPNPSPSTLTSSNKEGSQSGADAINNKANLGVKAKIDGLLLNENSRGANGFDGVSITWQLNTPPPATIFSTKGKNIKLEKGTQMMLRMFL